MADTASNTETYRASRSYRDYGGRTRSYGALGVLLLLALVTAVVLAYFQVQGPNLVVIEVAVWLLALVTFVIALCVLYVLFTLRGALRLVRQQATEVAVVRALAHRHEILEPAPAPTIEYRDAPAATAAHTAPLPGPTYVPPMVESRNVEIIEGIGPVFARRLARSGIETLRDLRAATSQQVADASKAPLTAVDRWKAMADLMVIRSIDAQAAELLVACGTFTVEGLAAQDVDSLYRRCQQNNTRGSARIMPTDVTRDQVASWVEASQRYGTDGSTNTTPRGDTRAAAESF